MSGSINGSSSPLKCVQSSAKYRSIRASTRTKPPIIYSSLHKKTYFNALEKMLMSPEHIGKGEQYSNIEVANSAFDEIFKKPPSRFDPKRAKKARKDGKPNLNIDTAGFDIDEDDEEDESIVDKTKGGTAELCWYDTLISKQNISKNDQSEGQKSPTLAQSPFQT